MIDLSDFVPFTRRRARCDSRTPRVRIDGHGVVVLNGAAYALCGFPAALELLYEPHSQRLALRAAAPDTVRPVPVRHQKGDRYVFSARRFLAEAGVDPRGGLLFRDPLHADGVLLLDPQTAQQTEAT